jgi:MFS family permease
LTNGFIKEAMILRAFRNLHPTTRRLLMARSLRSIGQGALVVDFALYLHALHWSGLAIGLVLSGSGLFGAGLSVLVGLSSDRLRRKPFLLSYEFLSLLCGLAALLSADPPILVIAAVLGGFGRGAGGAAGPFSPVEQAWLAEEVAPERRGWVYSLNTGLGLWGMGLGAFTAVLPSLWGGWLGGALAYRPLFALVGLTAAANLFLVARAHERYRGPKQASSPQGKEAEAQIRLLENRILAKLVFINSFNGLAIGLTGPLISYWFALRFQVGPLAIAPVMATTFVITGVASVLTGLLTGRIGIVQSVFWERLIGVGLMVLLPLMPTYWLASTIYLLRSVFARGSAGAQQALTVGLVRDERRGLAASLNAVSFQLPRSVGPGIAGYLLEAGQFSLPFYAAAVLQGVYLVWYRKVFRFYEPPRKRPGESGEPRVTPAPPEEEMG